jgi:hypothetical protein
MFVTPFDHLDTWAMPKVGFEPTKHMRLILSQKNKVIAVRKNIVQIYKALVHKVLFPNPGFEPVS